MISLTKPFGETRRRRSNRVLLPFSTVELLLTSHAGLQLIATCLPGDRQLEGGGELTDEAQRLPGRVCASQPEVTSDPDTRRAVCYQAQSAHLNSLLRSKFQEQGGLRDTNISKWIKGEHF
ncbi:hypothetical protein FKM82_023629 [Ascaphus truei]